MQESLTTTYLLLGTNMGDRMENIEKALALLSQGCGNITNRSAVYETAAWGNTAQPSFYNIAVKLETSIAPLSLIDKILDIEAEIGRVRTEKWGPRLIDIDIVFYGDLIVDVPNKLVVPHPEMQNRKFVLLPLSEITGEFIHPKLNKSVTVLLLENKDELPVAKLS